MKFSIRDLFFVTAIVALAVVWGIVRYRLARMWRVMDEESRTWLLDPPSPGSSAAMDAFMREIKRPKSSRLDVATEVCFIPHASAANYAPLLSKAEHQHATAAGVAYEFWCEGKGPKEGGYCVAVEVAGTPPVIDRAYVTGWNY